MQVNTYKSMPYEDASGMLGSIQNLGDALIILAKYNIEMHNYEVAGSIYKRCVMDGTLRWLRYDIENGQYTKVNKKIQAQYLYGNAILTGVAQDDSPTEGPIWIEKAAESGCEEAMRQLASMYLNGWGVEKDQEKSEMWRMRTLSKYDPNPVPNVVNSTE
jgi:TPR repeat protein